MQLTLNNAVNDIMINYFLSIISYIDVVLYAEKAWMP